MDNLDDFTRAYIEAALWSSIRIVKAYETGDDKLFPTMEEAKKHADFIYRTHGFIVAIDETETEEHLDENHDIDDLSPELLAQVKADCADFQESNKELLEEAYQLYRRTEWSPQAQAGHDFWLTRNWHGAGFWDRGLGEVGQKLSNACRPYGTQDWYVGDDGKVYS